MEFVQRHDLDSIEILVEVDQVLEACVDKYDCDINDCGENDFSVEVTPKLHNEEYHISVGPYLDREESNLDASSVYIMVSEESLNTLEQDFKAMVKQIANLKTYNSDVIKLNVKLVKEARPWYIRWLNLK